MSARKRVIRSVLKLGCDKVSGRIGKQRSGPQKSVIRYLPYRSATSKVCEKLLVLLVPFPDTGFHVGLQVILVLLDESGV